MSARLRGKKILLGVTGGIAAYKTANLVRLFVKEGAEVKVVMTPAAAEFVTPLTLATLSKNPVAMDFVKDDGQGIDWNNHVELGLWADLFVIAPVTANTLSKLATGNSDNFLVAVYLSAKCPIYLAPAMDLDMYLHGSTHANFTTLKGFGNQIIEAEVGELASGLYGQGRMAEPEHILEFIIADLRKNQPLVGKRILLTAGPTYEAIDPVRFIGNHSTGLMGYELAEEAACLGAQVTLVSGPTHLTVEQSDIEVIRVRSAQEMYEACLAKFATTDVLIAAAAVADYRPVEVAQQKIKKSDEAFTIRLEKTTDILASLGAIKKNQFVVGFALETENEIENAKLKIRKKNLDLIVLNSLRDQGAGFGHPTNRVTLIDKEFNQQTGDLKSKREVARDILSKVIENYAKNS